MERKINTKIKRTKRRRPQCQCSGPHAMPPANRRRGQRPVEWRSRRIPPGGHWPGFDDPPSQVGGGSSVGRDLTTLLVEGDWGGRGAMRILMGKANAGGVGISVSPPHSLKHFSTFIPPPSERASESHQSHPPCCVLANQIDRCGPSSSRIIRLPFIDRRGYSEEHEGRLGKAAQLRDIFLWGRMRWMLHGVGICFDGRRNRNLAF